MNMYGGGSGPIWLDELLCTGSEAHLFNCSHLGWGSNNCEHSEDVSVSCYNNSGTGTLLSHHFRK